MISVIVDEEMFENVASGIMRKSDFLFEKFRILMMKESMVNIAEITC